MNVLIVSPYALCTPHFETELEIAQRHLDAGDSVTFLCCDSDLPICEFNYLHDLHWCKVCIRMRRAGLALLAGQFIQLPLLMLTQQDRIKIQNLRKQFLSLDDLRSYSFENLDIGWAVISSLVHFSREPNPDLQCEPYKNLIESMVSCSAQVYLSVINQLRQRSFNQVYVFNGRFFSLRPAIRACEAIGVKFFAHDRGANKNRYQLYENVLPQNMNYVASLIKTTWDNAQSFQDRETIASQFFTDSSRGVSLYCNSFTDHQKENLVPDNWDESKTNLVIFVSSDDEFVSIDNSYLSTIYIDQTDGIKRIIQSLSNYPDVHIYLRIHPNLRSIDNSQVKFLSALESNNLTVIAADSLISSYALMQKASKVLTFGSTIGIEATFWGKPSILAGNCFYQDLEATYNPSSHEELLDLILSDLPAKPREGSLMYGYYSFTFGTPFKYFRSTDFFSGEFYSNKDNNFHDLSLATKTVISIIIPTYNRAHMLDITIESFVNQNYPPGEYEIIIVDNNSTDNTREIVNHWIKKSSIPIQYVFEKKQGVHYARNTGAKISQGDILYFTDDDMLSDPDLLTEIIKPFSIDDGIGSVTGKILPKFEKTPPQWILDYCSNEILSLQDKKEDLIIAPYDCGVFSCHQAIRRDVFFSSGGFNPENTAGVMIGDGETGLNIKIADLGYKFAYTSRSIIYHMIPMNRTTLQYLVTRLGNQGFCDSYTDYRKHRNRYMIIILMIKRNTIGIMCSVAMTTAKVALGRLSWHFVPARLMYFYSRNIYDWKLYRNEKFRNLVEIDNWLTHEPIIEF